MATGSGQPGSQSSQNPGSSTSTLYDQNRGQTLGSIGSNLPRSDRNGGSQSYRDARSASLRAAGLQGKPVYAWEFMKNSYAKAGCDETLKIYKYAMDNQPGLPRGNTAKYLCKVPTFNEQTHTSQVNEIRLFIEGAEVTSYVRDSITWTVESTGGMNSCSFTLNNDQDAFIITPKNVCADLNLSGWKVGRDHKGNVLDNPGRENSRFDELAKYQIYRRKYNMVNPKGKNNTAQIESGTNMWLYPLNPFSCIINRHDCVRLFVRLPFTSGKLIRHKDGRKTEAYDLWIPAFTGFVRSVNWTDDPVGGDRTVSVNCYDYRGLLERMRVRTSGFRTTPGKTGGGKPGEDFGTDSPVLDKLVLSDDAKKILDKLGILQKIHRLYQALLELGIARCSDKSDAACLSKASGDALEKPVKLTQEAIAQYQLSLVASTALLNVMGESWGLSRKTKIVFEKTNDTTKLGDKKIFERVKGEVNSNKQIWKLRWGSAIAYLERLDVTTDAGAQVVNSYYSQYSSFLTTTAGLTGVTAVATNPAMKKAALIALVPNNDNLKSDLERKSEIDVNNDIQQKMGELLELKSGKAIQILTSGSVGSGPNATTGKPVLTSGGSKIISFIGIGDSDALATRLSDVLKLLDSTLKAIDDPSSSEQIANGKKAANKLNDIESKIDDETRKALQQQQSIASNSGASNLRNSKNIARKMAEARRQAKLRAKGKYQPSNIAELIIKEPTFEGGVAGIFDDLITATTTGPGGTPHPLANKSFEEAVHWLCLTQSQITPGVVENVTKYANGSLEKWNRETAFGHIGRPLTFNEVTIIGKGTHSDYNESVFSPINAFLHILLPAKGTGAATIIQADVSANPAAADNYEHSTRLGLLNEISTLLDYQFYVSPFGDLVFELPNYNSVPDDYGKTFQNAYKVSKDWKGGDINEEAENLYTGWVFTGNEDEALANAVTKGKVASNYFKKTVVMAPILARRIGVNVDYVPINLPGVGAQITGPSANNSATQNRGNLNAIRVWGLIYIQRQLGAAHTISAPLPFRPYMLPNRPLHVIPRQRIGLINTVSYSMTPPNGECSVNCNMKYVRWLFRDGTFRTIAGGWRQPIDYTGFYTGEVPSTFNNKEGVAGDPSRTSGNPSEDYKTTQYLARGSYPPAGSDTNNNQTNFSCAPSLKGYWLQSASSYGDDLSDMVQPTNTYGANTSGSSGVAKTPQNPPDPDTPTTSPDSNATPTQPQHVLGSRVHRVVDNPAQGASDNVSLNGTGLRETGKDGKYDKTKIKPKYDITNLFHNPYPFSFDHHNYNNFMIRTVHRSTLTGYRAQAIKGRGRYVPWHKAKSAPHAGVDIYVPTGTPIYAPINLHSIRAYMQVGPKSEAGASKTVDVTASVGSSEYRNLLKFAQFKNGKPAEKFDSTATRATVTIYETPYKVWKRLGSNLPVSRGSGARGLYINCYGRVMPPKLANDPNLSRSVQQSGSNGIPCFMSFKHCNSAQRKGSSIISKANKGDQIGEVGITGTHRAHLHLDMRVFIGNDASRGEEDIFKEVAKANREYLETLILLKVTGGNPNADQISPEWQNYFKARRKNVTSVKDAVRVLSELYKPFRKYTDPTTGKLWTNPFFFFKPEDIIRSAKLNEIYDKVYYSTAPLNSSGKGESDNNICGVASARSIDKLKRELNNCMLKSFVKSTDLVKRRDAVRQCQKVFADAIQKINSANTSQVADNTTGPRLDSTIDRNPRDRQNGSDRPSGAGAA